MAITQISTKATPVHYTAIDWVGVWGVPPLSQITVILELDVSKTVRKIYIVKRVRSIERRFERTIYVN